MDRQEEFQKRLLATFRQEAGDRLQALITGLLQLEGQPGDQPAIVEAAFRAVHSLKGAASVVGEGAVTQLCQAVESYFSALRKGQGQIDVRSLEVLHFAADYLGELLMGEGAQATDESRLREIIGAIEKCQHDIHPSSSPGFPAAVSRGPEPAIEEPASVRVSATQVSTILWQTEQLVGSKLTGAWLMEELARIRHFVSQERLSVRRRPSTVLQPAGRELSSADEEFQSTLADVHHHSLLSLLNDLDPALTGLERLAAHHQRQMTRIVDELVEEVRSLSLSPAQSLLDAFPKVVRDLARELGKQARLQIEGGDLELDRRILDHLRDPLLHLVRNAVGHGLESPDQRGHKNPTGLIRISVRPVEGQRIEFVIRDDGAGIDLERVEQAAVACGAISSDKLAAMSESERLELIFLPGMTTREEADPISGRGLGLSIVQEKIQALGGTITVASTTGEGATFRLYLPMRVATLRGVLVEVGAYWLVVPESDIDHVGRLSAASLHRTGSSLVANTAGRAIPLLRLADLLGIESASSAQAKALVQVVYIGTPEPVLALQVDAIRGEHEFLLKSLRPPLRGIRWYSGMTVNGQGRVIPVLQTAELIRAMANGLAAGRGNTPSTQPAARKPLSILLAEDSITSRIFLKNLLESLGHTVTSVGDGEEAWNELRRGSFDLLLTDVEMPVMDGYALTEKVRADSRMTDLPVILITALDSPQHRQRGLAAGADAYLVKNQFDHEQLLDTITRLVPR